MHYLTGDSFGIIRNVLIYWHFNLIGDPALTDNKLHVLLFFNMLWLPE